MIDEVDIYGYLRAIEDAYGEMSRRLGQAERRLGGDYMTEGPGFVTDADLLAVIAKQRDLISEARAEAQQLRNEITTLRERDEYISAEMAKLQKELRALRPHRPTEASNG